MSNHPCSIRGHELIQVEDRSTNVLKIIVGNLGHVSIVNIKKPPGTSTPRC